MTELYLWFWQMVNRYRAEGELAPDEYESHRQLHRKHFDEQVSRGNFGLFPSELVRERWGVNADTTLNYDNQRNLETVFYLVPWGD